MRATGLGTTLAAQFSFSRLGSLAYVAGSASAPSQFQNSLALIDRNGNRKPVELPPGPYAMPRFSPDGRRIAFVIDTDPQQIWVYELSGASSVRQLTFTGRNAYPVWSPDGKRLTFLSDREGDQGIFWQLADGTGAAERLTKPEQRTSHQPESWFPDGQRLVFSVVKQGNASSWFLSLPDKKEEPFVEVPSSNGLRASVSPDGRWVAYQSGETGRNEIFVESFPKGTKFRITKDGGRQPVWGSDGKELFYNVMASGGSTRIAVVSVSTRPSFTFGNPVQLAIDGIQATGPTQPRNFDIAPDGKTFIAVVSNVTDNDDTASQVQVVLNWFEDLKRRVPVN
jgi:serine/threonine-protein kinase